MGCCVGGGEADQVGAWGEGAEVEREGVARQMRDGGYFAALEVEKGKLPFSVSRPGRLIHHDGDAAPGGVGEEGEGEGLGRCQRGDAGMGGDGESCRVAPFAPHQGVVGRRGVAAGLAETHLVVSRFEEPVAESVVVVGKGVGDQDGAVCVGVPEAQLVEFADNVPFHPKAVALRRNAGCLRCRTRQPDEGVELTRTYIFKAIIKRPQHTPGIIVVIYNHPSLSNTIRKKRNRLCDS